MYLPFSCIKGYVIDFSSTHPFIPRLLKTATGISNISITQFIKIIHFFYFWIIAIEYWLPDLYIWWKTIRKRLSHSHCYDGKSCRKLKSCLEEEDILITIVPLIKKNQNKKETYRFEQESSYHITPSTTTRPEYLITITVLFSIHIKI